MLMTNDYLCIYFFADEDSCLWVIPHLAGSEHLFQQVLMRNMQKCHAWQQKLIVIYILMLIK